MQSFQQVRDPLRGADDSPRRRAAPPSRPAAGRRHWCRSRSSRTTNAAGEALDGIAARLAAPFAAGEIGVDLLARQALEAHARLDQAPPQRRPGRRPARARYRPDARGRREAEAGFGLVADLAFGQDAPPDATTVSAASVRHGASSGTLTASAAELHRLFRRQPLRQRARQFAAPRRLVDFGRQTRNRDRRRSAREERGGGASRRPERRRGRPCKRAQKSAPAVRRSAAPHLKR